MVGFNKVCVALLKFQFFWDLIYLFFWKCVDFPVPTYNLLKSTFANPTQKHSCKWKQVIEYLHKISHTIYKKLKKKNYTKCYITSTGYTRKRNTKVNTPRKCGWVGWLVDGALTFDLVQVLRTELLVRPVQPPAAPVRCVFQFCVFESCDVRRFTRHVKYFPSIPLKTQPK